MQTPRLFAEAFVFNPGESLLKLTSVGETYIKD